ncbi:MAG: NfeD family protein [Eubacteriales bacterium]|nr:NfeD family protein [Eubacteriales bacterium]
MEVISWLALLIVLVVIELATMGLTTIWFAGGALVATIAAACGAPLFLQIALFLIVSVVLLVFTRPLAMRYFNTGRTKTNVDSVIGERGIVTEAIDNLKGCGQVTLNGMQWTARSAQEEITIPEGTVVLVESVDGVKLIVKAEKEESGL